MQKSKFGLTITFEGSYFWVTFSWQYFREGRIIRIPTIWRFCGMWLCSYSYYEVIVHKLEWSYSDIRAHRDWPLWPKIEYRDSHTWIFIGNWIFVGLFSSLFFIWALLLLQKCDFIFCTFYMGKMPKIGPKINKIEIWPKSGLRVITS